MKNQIFTKRWMPPGRGMLAALLTLCCCFISQMAWADIDCTYSSDGGVMTFEHECPWCGTIRRGDCQRDTWSYDEAYEDAQNQFYDQFCEDCGGCLLDFYYVCCMEHHCQVCDNHMPMLNPSMGRFIVSPYII